MDNNGNGKPKEKDRNVHWRILIVPNGGINVDFLKKLNHFIRDQLAKNPTRQFFWSQEADQLPDTIVMPEEML